jgi:hypothetical protein
MKKTVSAFTLFSTVVLLSSAQFGLSSCQKEVIKIVKDTVELKVEVPGPVPAPPIDTLAVLTGKEYHMEEITILQEDEFFYYKKGQAGNTAQFDQDFIKFNANKTGSYSYSGQTHTIEWDFIGNAKTRIRYTLNRPTPIVITMENISYSGDTLSYTEYYTVGAIKSMSSVLRIAR